MENLTIVRLVDLFMINSDIILRVGTRQAGSITCTLGATVTNSLCKSFYSTRCANTTSAFNLFFQDDVIYYNDDLATNINTLGNFDNIYTSRFIIPPTPGISPGFFPDGVFTRDIYDRQYAPTVEEICNFILTRTVNTLYTFSFSEPTFPVPAGTQDNLVGHIYNIMRVQEGGVFRNYIIQGYIFKYSPICIQISDDMLRDYIRVFYAIKTRSGYITATRDYNHFLTPPNVVYTMFIYDFVARRLFINPWFNDKFRELFKEYYYNPFPPGDRVNKVLSSTDLQNRSYVYVQLSIANVVPSYVTFYNMLAFMYTYYGIISYDIYVYRMQALTLRDPMRYGYFVQYRYLTYDFITEVGDRNDTQYVYEYNNPSVFIDNDLTTKNRHINIFWENNPFMRFSYILSDKNIPLVPGNYNEEQLNFIFDLYSTLLYSAKTAIMNANSYVETVNCNQLTVITEGDARSICMDTIMVKSICSGYDTRGNIQALAKLLEKVYTPHHMLINSFDMYDYYNDKSCIMYKIIIDTLNVIQTMIDENRADSIFGPIGVIYNQYIALTPDQINDLPERVRVFCLNISRIMENRPIVRELGSERRPNGTTINGYQPIVLNALISFIVSSLGFYLCTIISKKLIVFYNSRRGLPLDDTTNINLVMAYNLYALLFYFTNITPIRENINLIFIEIGRIIENIIDTQYADIDLNIDQVTKPYAIFIKTIKNIMLTELGATEEQLIEHIRITFPNAII